MEDNQDSTIEEIRAEFKYVINEYDLAKSSDLSANSHHHKQ